MNLEKALKLIVCPECRGDVSCQGAAITCPGCKTSYEVKNGIPLMYPNDMDREHLAEEEHLADEMKNSPDNRYEAFILEQWNISKEEFWDMVVSNVDKKDASGTFINIGSGFDQKYFDHGLANDYVSFDLVFTILNELKSRNIERQTCIGGDISQLPFKDQMFDYLVNIDVLHHHTDELEKIIESFYSILKPGGKLFLEDTNAWGLFQMHKSILLPQSIHQLLRKYYHNVKKSDHQPADYEFPTKAENTLKILKDTGFRNIRLYPNNSYPNIGPLKYKLYKLLSRWERVPKYHNFHYMVSAEK